MIDFFCELPHRALIQITGDDRFSFLQGLITNDINEVTEQRAIYAALLTPQGKFLYDLFIISFKDSLIIESERTRLHELIKKLSLYKLRSKVEIIDWQAKYKVYACSFLQKSFEKEIGFTDPRLKDLGKRIYLPIDQQISSELNSFDGYDLHRLSLGIPDGSRDIPIEKGIILEHGLEELNAIDWSKGCYVGQELTARTRYRGIVRKRLFPVKVDGPLPKYGEPIYMEGEEVGEMRTSIKGIGLAMLRLSCINQESFPTLNACQAILKPYIPNWMKLPVEENHLPL